MVIKYTCESCKYADRSYNDNSNGKAKDWYINGCKKDQSPEYTTMVIDCEKWEEARIYEGDM